MTRGKGWATAAFLLGIGVSVAANVAHTWHPAPEVLKAYAELHNGSAAGWRPELGAQAMAAFYPVALLLTVEILARVPWPHSFGWSAARYGGAALVAGVAAVVSYRHMAGLLAAYGEDPLTAKIGPLSVDGLMVVASFALLAIGRTPDAELRPIEPFGRTIAEAKALVKDTAIDGRGDRPATPVNGSGQVHAPEPVPAVPVDPDPIHIRAAEVFADQVAAGTVPSIADIKAALRVGQPKATSAQTYLRALTRS